MAIDERRKLFTSFIPGSERKLSIHKNISQAKLSRTQHIFSAGIIKKVQEELNKNLPGVLEESNISSDEKISVEVTDFFDSNGTTPKIKIKSSFEKMGINGQKIEAFIDNTFNSYWGKVHSLSEDIIELRSNLQENDQEQKRLLQISENELKNLLGYENVFYEMSEKNIPFDTVPNSINVSGKNSKKRKTQDIGKATGKYLNFFLDCFVHGGKNPIMQHDGLMPRVIATVASKDGKSFELNISPSLSYMPLMFLRQFEHLFGPFDFFKEKNARLELVGEGENKTVVQKIFHGFCFLNYTLNKS